MNIEFPKRFQSDITDAIAVIVKLIDLRAGDWTKPQAKAISGAMLEFTQEEIADSWFEKEITQQGIAQHLKRAGWSTIELGIEYLEKLIPRIINPEYSKIYYKP
jgi:hypothetical protein